MRARHQSGSARPLVVLGVVVVLLIAAGAMARAQGWWPGAAARSDAGDPLRTHRQYAAPSPLLQAADAQAHGDGDTRASTVLDRLAKIPTGIWLTPERFGTPADVGAFVTSTVRAAGSEVPVFVVYGIPHRDCAADQSTGGLDDATYPAWVQAIATAAGARGHAVVVLEPDALATAGECHLRGERVKLVSGAVAALRGAGVTTYVDAGHSAWVAPTDMAALLKAVGVGSVRGFATNVSNYQPQDAELAYAEALRRDLGGGHFIIDSGRNGATGPGPTDWCNPPGRALGRAPGYVDDGTGLDALVWIKPPAESDGTCHGGPAAGEVWTQRAVELATAAGW